MFRRRWSGLPEDPDFPIDLEKLGYCIQPETDEIRSIANPNFYFHYFHTKNERYNDRQRFAFNLAVQEVVHTRLEALGLTKISLPNEDQHHRSVPIFVSKNLHQADRVVVIFGEGSQQLGILAHRAMNSQGGVDKGSVVELIKDLLQQSSTSNDEVKKGGGEGANKTSGTEIVLANPGERWWWPEGQRPLCHRESMGVKMKSCVHKVGSFDAAVNLIPGSESVQAHVESIFERILSGTNQENGNQKSHLASGARIQVVAVGEAAPAVETYLDKNWEHWKDKIDCLAMLGDGKLVYDFKNDGFKTFLRERARIYITTRAPLDTPLSNPEGNPKSMNITSYGCPVLSSGEPYYVELTLIKAKDAVLSFLNDAYKAGAGLQHDGIAYINPTFEISYAEEDVPEETYGWGATPSGGVPSS